MLVVLLQAGRGGGIGLAFGGSGGSQSVFGSSGGATFLTKLTAVCAILFMTNSLVLAYMSSQSDSRRLERIATKKAQDKKAEDAANVKMLTDIEKQRAEQTKAAAQKSEAAPSGEPSEGAPGEDKAAAAAKAELPKSGPSLQLKLPEAAGGKVVPAAPGKLAADLKLDKTAAPKSEAEPAEGTPGQDKAEDKAPVIAGKASDEKPNSALKLTLPPPAGGKPVAGAPGKLAADLKLGKPGVQPAAQAKPGVQPAAQAKPGVQPAAQAKPAVQPAAQAKPAVQPAAQAKPAVQPAAQAKPAVQPKQPIAKKPVVEKKSDENSAEKPAAE